MKSNLLLLAFMVGTHVFAQDKEAVDIFAKDPASNDFYYEEVVQASGQKKDVLYDRAKKWIIANLKTDDNNITFDDKESSITNSAAIKIDRRFFFGLDIKEGYFDFKFHIWIKDDRLKVRMDNIMYQLIVEKSHTGGTTIEPRAYAYADLENNKLGRYLKKQANEKTIAFLQVFRKAVVDGEQTKKDDW